MRTPRKKKQTQSTGLFEDHLFDLFNVYAERVPLKKKGRVHDLDELFKVYGLKKGDYHALAFHIAYHHQPGFRPPRYRFAEGDWGCYLAREKNEGRSLGWTHDKYEALAKAVDKVKYKNGSLPDVEALRQIVKNGEWSRPLNRSPNAWLKTLQNRLSEARKLRRNRNRWADYALEFSKKPNPEK